MLTNSRKHFILKAHETLVNVTFRCPELFALGIWKKTFNAISHTKMDTCESYPKIPPDITFQLWVCQESRSVYIGVSAFCEILFLSAGIYLGWIKVCQMLPTENIFINKAMSKYVVIRETKKSLLLIKFINCSDADKKENPFFSLVTSSPSFFPFPSPDSPPSLCSLLFCFVDFSKPSSPSVR